MNCAVVDRRVVFRTAWTSSLASLGAGARVGFEADHADQVAESGWSVLVRGRLRDVTDGPEHTSWSELVDTMIAHGAKLDETEAAALVDYLVEHFGPGTR